jgi:hypothetical protein
MKTNKIFPLLAVAGALILTSCTDWLDQEPISNVSTSSYFKNADQFQAAANNLYSKLDVIGTVLYDNGTDLSQIGLNEISGNIGAPASDNVYSEQYKRLRTANNIIEQGEKYSGTDNIDAPLGTAYFFRAWFHFGLLQRFGGIPLALSVPQTQSDFVWGPRNSRYEVIASILSDLEKAQQLMASTTKTSTSNDGSLDIEAVDAFKARVCLYEGTWEKYNGRGAEDVTNGDGTTSGAGTAMPDGYPSVTELLTMAKNESAKFVSGGQYASEYSLWMECEDSDIPFYQHTSSRYLFILENAASNPSGADKSSNNESILRRCYEASLQSKGIDGTHGQPCSGNRKLMDMFLCTDGLPINISPLFKGYHGLDSEFKNRDARMTSLFQQIGHAYWSANNEHGAYANFSISPDSDANNKSGIFAPILTSYAADQYNNNNGYQGMKFEFEARRDEGHSADLMLIRLPEMLLVNAEATIELNGSITDDELNNTINIIRKRAHIANLTNALVNQYGLDMKEEIRRERALELFGEGFRLYDLCRWGIAETELDRPVCVYYSSYNGEATELTTADRPGFPGTKFYDEEVWIGHKITTDQAQSVYTAGMPQVKTGALVIIPESQRNFSKRDYLQAIPTDQITLNPNLKQNPQW